VFARSHRARAATLAVALCAIIALVPARADAARTRSCSPVDNPYPGTRYAGVDLTRIRATGVSCATARSVARRAHRRALHMPVTGPVKRFTWNGWRVRGDLRGEHDSYVATKADRRIRWRF
jgi:hypothetical protein